mmetsp:Transcript_22479/g.44165  ORF Transcript_22479/g.44165 Transcript_22479/m.44165 type:complete len:400 (+) Transcript_22479:23-1222(+)
MVVLSIYLSLSLVLLLHQLETVARSGLGDLELLLVHVRANALEEGGGEVSLSVIRNDGQDVGSRGCLLGNIQSHSHGGSSTDTTEDTLLLGKELGSLNCALAINGENLIESASVLALLEERRDEVRGPTLNGVCAKGRVGTGCGSVRVALLGSSAREESCRCRFASNHLGLRASSLDGASGSKDGATSSVSKNEVVEVTVRECREDLRTSGACVVIRIVSVVELAGLEPSVLLSKLASLADHAGTLLRSGSEHDLGTEHTHSLAALYTEGLDHGDNTVNTTSGAHHCEGNSSVTTGGLHNSIASLELTTAHSLVDNSESKTVLNRGERVEVLELAVHVHALRSDVVDANDGGLTNGLGDVVVDTTTHGGRGMDTTHGVGTGGHGAGGASSETELLHFGG